MSGTHAHALYVHGHSPVHRLAPECKLAAQFLFVIAIVTTPREAFWAFGCYVVIVGALIALAGIPPRFVARRLVFEIPFIAFALFLPIVGQGARTEVVGVSLSVEGLWGLWNIVAKATLGLAVSIVVASTTTMAEFLRGFDRLRMPRAFTSIASFMVRYADVIAEEMRRMRIARLSRGFEGRWIWQVRAVAASAGTLFIRSYERGERVYLSMLSRGFTGSMPDLGEPTATRAMWVGAMALPIVGAAIAATAWQVTAR
ncbi:MAG: cobalt ECF transporter T component CbiQ [Actinomycetota bacterium]